MGFSCLLITHDLATVEFLCDRVAVMFLVACHLVEPGGAAPRLVEPPAELQAGA